MLPSRLPNPSSRPLLHLLSGGFAVRTSHLEFALARRPVLTSPALPLIFSGSRHHPASVDWLEEVELSEPSKRMDGSIESKQLSALSGSSVAATETREGSSVSYSSAEEQTEQSKSHWSIWAEFESAQRRRSQRHWRKLLVCCSNEGQEEEEEEAEVSNVRDFKVLQQHPTLGGFFYKFNGDDGSTLEVGEKFAEGGQTELCHANVKWGNPKMNEEDVKEGTQWVVKVFKEGTLLRQLPSQLPQGLVQFHAEDRINWKSPTPKRFPRFYSEVYLGTLLEDGRFAFMMRKEHFDLRSLIERKMKSRSRGDWGPFPKEDAECIMYCVALGMDSLHSLDIVHRDLKASDVLVRESVSDYLKWYCFVADYECSIGVIGVGFFRAAEILQALKERKLSQKPEVFSKAVDVYSYGMTCYEILTGKLPFEGHPQNEYDLVLNGEHLEVPKYLPDWTRELLSRCWQSNPIARPTFGEILNLLSRSSVEVRKYEDVLKGEFGKNFRSLFLIENTNS